MDSDLESRLLKKLADEIGKNAGKGKRVSFSSVCCKYIVVGLNFENLIAAIEKEIEVDIPRERALEFISKYVRKGIEAEEIGL